MLRQRYQKYHLLRFQGAAEVRFSKWPVLKRDWVKRSNSTAEEDRSIKFTFGVETTRLQKPARVQIIHWMKTGSQVETGTSEGVQVWQRNIKA